MKCFHFSYSSMYLGGDAIIFASDEKRAREIFSAYRPDVMEESSESVEVKRIPSTKEHFVEINNGDY